MFKHPNISHTCRRQVSTMYSLRICLDLLSAVFIILQVVGRRKCRRRGFDELHVTFFWPRVCSAHLKTPGASATLSDWPTSPLACRQNCIHGSLSRPKKQDRTAATWCLATKTRRSASNTIWAPASDRFSRREALEAGAGPRTAP